MGKDQELLEASRSGDVAQICKLLSNKGQKLGPIQATFFRWVNPDLTLTNKITLTLGL